MSVLVINMEMPKICDKCPLFDLESWYCNALHRQTGITKPNDCPLVEVPVKIEVVTETPFSQEDINALIEDLKTMPPIAFPDEDTCEDVGSARDDFECSKCGVHLEDINYLYEFQIEYCPSCGRKVVRKNEGT